MLVTDITDIDKPSGGRKLSRARKVVADFLHASRSVPLVCFQRVMCLRELRETRQRAGERASWCSVFTKAFSRVVADRPPLRQAYLSFPAERLHGYAQVSADVVVEARLGDEDVIFPVRLREPHNAELRDLDAQLNHAKANPLGVRRYARALALARWPRFVRRLAWWYLTQVSGRNRERYLGTFGVSGVARLGVNSIRPLVPWTTVLHYGVIAPDGHAPIHLSFDHRVFDGSEAARALTGLEEVLHDEILSELRDERPGRTPYRTSGTVP